MSQGACTLRKHLNAVGITTWEDITRASLYDLRDELLDTVAASSAKQTLSALRAILNRVKDEIELPQDFAKILSVKGDVARSTFLTQEELKAFEAVPVKGRKSKIAQIEFLIEAYTGARLSDVMQLTAENFTADGFLTYTAKKNKVTATVPVSEKTKGWILYAQQHREDEPTLACRNRIIRRIAQQAGINEMVKTRRGGVERVTPKYEVLASHCGRRSMVSNLIAAGASLNDAKLCAAHTSTSMTERYCCVSKPNLSAKAMRYFM